MPDLMNLVEAGEDARLIEKRISTMTTYFPDAMIDGYESLIPTMTCDPKDRHVLAAAVRGGAEVLVTSTSRTSRTRQPHLSTSRSCTLMTSSSISPISTTRRRDALSSTWSTDTIRPR